jgi:hypothetical protein
MRHRETNASLSLRCKAAKWHIQNKFQKIIDASNISMEGSFRLHQEFHLSFEIDVYPSRFSGTGPVRVP